MGRDLQDKCITEQQGLDDVPRKWSEQGKMYDF